MATTNETTLASASWTDFANRHVGQPFLISEALYSLSEPIIDAIHAEIPDFFSEAQAEFERDLARTASFGFFYQRMFGISSSDRDSGTSSLASREARTAVAINRMLRTEYLRAGVPETEICEHMQTRADRREVIDARKVAYIGWLVTNPQFRTEVDQLQSRWESMIREAGRFPHFPYWPCDDFGAPVDFPRELDDTFLAFYRRWGLRQMLTWDWPVPLEPDLAVGMYESQDLGDETGVLLFVPWYLLRGEKLSLQEIVRQHRSVESPAHLREWVQKTRRKRDEMGDQRYERLAWLYRFLELALRRRYPEACRRRAQKLDQAFGTVLELDPQSVRKPRLEMQRLLN